MNIVPKVMEKSWKFVGKNVYEPWYLHTGDVFWIGNQGEGTSPNCTLYFSDFITSFSFSLWLREWDHFKRYQTCMVTYLYILHCMDFSVNFRWWGEGEMMRPSVQGVDPPVCCTPGCYCYICKRQFCGFTGRAFCPLEGGPRYPGTSLTVTTELKAPRGKRRLWYYFHLNHLMAQKHGVALSKIFAFQDALGDLPGLWHDRVQKRNVDSVLTWSNILCF